MKKLVIVLLGILGFSLANSANLKLTTAVSAPVDRVGNADGSASLATNRPGFLFKFELPVELQGAEIDLAYLRFKVQTDTARKSLRLLVRPMLAPWVSGVRLTTLPDSTASPYHANFGKVNLKTGDGAMEVTQALQAWQKGELPNLGFLVYPAERQASAFQLRSWPAGGVAELEVFYTPKPVE